MGCSYCAFVCTLVRSDLNTFMPGPHHSSSRIDSVKRGSSPTLLCSCSWLRSSHWDIEVRHTKNLNMYCCYSEVHSIATWIRTGCAVLSCEMTWASSSISCYRLYLNHLTLNGLGYVSHIQGIYQCQPYTRFRLTAHVSSILLFTHFPASLLPLLFSPFSRFSSPPLAGLDLTVPSQSMRWVVSLSLYPENLQCYIKESSGHCLCPQTKAYLGAKENQQRETVLGCGRAMFGSVCMHMWMQLPLLVIHALHISSVLVCFSICVLVNHCKQPSYLRCSSL